MKLRKVMNGQAEVIDDDGSSLGVVLRDDDTRLWLAQRWLGPGEVDVISEHWRRRDAAAALFHAARRP